MCPQSTPETNAWNAEQKSASYPSPVLVVMSGLPGTGKSYVSEWLARTLGAVVVESDRVRKDLFPRPNYGATENAIVHGACRKIIGGILLSGHLAIYDATNLIEDQRRTVYALARACGAQLFIVRTTASREEVQRRLARRRDQQDSASDADWEVYQRMAASQEPIARGHIELDTTRGVAADLGPLALAIHRVATTAMSPTSTI